MYIYMINFVCCYVLWKKKKKKGIAEKFGWDLGKNWRHRKTADVIKKKFHQHVHEALVYTCDKFQGKSIRNGEVMEGEPNQPPSPVLRSPQKARY